MMKHIIAGRQKGLSLLEMIVALAILGVSLGALYQAAGGASRIVQTSERYAYAVSIAEALLAEHALVPDGGLDISGETGGDYTWHIVAVPLPDENDPPLARLMDIRIQVSWGEARSRTFELRSVVAGMAPE